MKKQEFATKQYLDKKLEEHSKAIIEAVNFGFEKVNNKIEVVEERLEGVEGKLEGVEKRLKGVEEKVDITRTLLDGYVKAQEDFREEFKIMKGKMSKVEKVLKEKLGVQI